MTGYVTKPVSPQALRDALEEWLLPATPDNTSMEVKMHPLRHRRDPASLGGRPRTYAEIGRIFMDELSWRIPGLRGSEPNELEHHAIPEKARVKYRGDRTQPPRSRAGAKGQIRQQRSN